MEQDPPWHYAMADFFFGQLEGKLSLLFARGVL
jgi:hypothetical protein